MPDGRFRSLPFGRWPVQDQARWAHACTASDPLDEPEFASTWRPHTRLTVAAAYGIALGWLLQHGLLDPSVPAGDRWPKAVLREYITAMEGTVSPGTVRHRLLNLERALAVIDPKSDRHLLRAAVKRFTSPPDRSRKRERLQHSAQLAELGFKLMEAAEQGRDPITRRNAALFRTGLQIALLAMRPLRMRNFSALVIGVHMLRDRDGWVIRIPGSESKNHRPIETSVPRALQSAIDRYIDHYRPLLAGDRYHGPRLWLGYRFDPQSAHTLQLAIVRETERAFGLPVNPHLFRDCAATSIAIDDPTSVRIAASVLGHAGFGSTEKYYNLATGLEAGRAYASVLRARRSGTKRL